MSLPPLNPRSSSLGSLAQSAREKKLKQARGILIVIGCLGLVWNGIHLGMARGQAKEAVAKEVQKRGLILTPEEKQEFEDKLVRLVTVIAIGFMAVDALFIVFGLLMRLIPIPATVISLVLYLGMLAVVAVLDRENHFQNVLRGIYIDIFVLVLLIQAIVTAVAYQRERNAAREEEEALEPEYE
jgi:hypothetical protein